MRQSLIGRARAEFHKTLLDDILTINSKGVATNADKDSPLSVDIASKIIDLLGASKTADRLPGQSSGNKFEQIVRDYVASTFPKLYQLRPGIWHIKQVTGYRLKISQFEQFAHLRALDEAARSNPELATALGNDYFIKPDIVVYREPESDDSINRELKLVDERFAMLTPIRKSNSLSPMLHASISCKWTLRSDRAQNARSEGLNLVKNRKGPLPHAVVVTGEPVPARVASLALGTGEIDMVYHFALPELIKACEKWQDAAEMVKIMVEGKRLKDISDLPLDLCI